NLATSGPGHEGLAALRAAGLPSGALSAFDVFVPAGTDPDRVAERLRGDPGVHAVAAPHAPEWRRDGSAVLTVVPVAETGSPARGAGPRRAARRRAGRRRGGARPGGGRGRARAGGPRGRPAGGGPPAGGGGRAALATAPSS